MTNKFICFVGIDGSGKTTLAQNLVEYLSHNGNPTRYAHIYHRPILLAPIKWLAQKAFLKGKHQFDGNYMQYRSEKLSSSQKHPLLSIIYSWLWLFDYSIQVIITSAIPNIFSQPRYYIADRYIFDTVLNIRTSLGWSGNEAINLIQEWFSIFKKPDLTFWININPELAFSRKDDIPSIEYLIERRLFYEELSKHFNFIQLDGSESQENLLLSTISYISREDQ